MNFKGKLYFRLVNEYVPLYLHLSLSLLFGLVDLTFIFRLKFADAFVLVRKHRINMNLLHDHNPAAFLDNIDSFVRQIDSVSYVNLFLTGLL